MGQIKKLISVIAEEPRKKNKIKITADVLSDKLVSCLPPRTDYLFQAGHPGLWLRKISSQSTTGATLNA